MPEDIPENLRILSLDSGDERCLSQLEILREFMHRLNVDTGTFHRPCDYFHWIGGIGAGGVVATLLVTLSMSAEEAELAFARICSSVFGEECTPIERASRLETIMKTLLEERNLSSEATLLDEFNPSNGCKLGLLHIPTMSEGHFVLYRNYKASQVTTYNPTIVQAIRLVWTTPSLFPLLENEPRIPQEYFLDVVNASNGFSNPILEVLKEVHGVFGPNATVSCLLSLGAGRAPLLSMVTTGSIAPKSLEQLAIDSERTASEVERRIGRIGVYFRLSVDRGLELDDLSKSMSRIVAHTRQYLLDEDVNKTLDSCIRSSEMESHITLNQLYHARAKSQTFLHNLPPLTAFFVPRPELMDALVTDLVENKRPEQHVMVLAGMGGSGKTQLTLKFARDFEDCFNPIMFIDASSVETIKMGLLTRLRKLSHDYAPETMEDCLEILENTEDPIFRNWLVIYDNADDPELDLRPFIPACNHGSILITTRNTALRNLAPQGYLEIDVMSPEEAITALLHAALPSGVIASPREREAATRIAQQLGYLPIAMIQAGCYIRQQECLYEYEDRLRANRKITLEPPAMDQQDTLRYGHSVYAALDITLEAISTSARHLLSLLSSVHFANFPRPLISAAAKSGFSLEIIKLLDRPDSFQTTIDFLSEIFCPTGSWDEFILADSVEELQQYSLISLVSFPAVVTFRLHPLIQAWAQDRLSPEDQEIYRAAVVRLMACGASRDNTILYEYLNPHIMSLSPAWSSLHVNDRIAFLRILDEDTDTGDAPLLLKRAQDIHDEVKSIVGEGDVRALRATLFLGGIYGSNGDISTMEKLETEVVNACEVLLGRENPDTIEAMFQLSGTYITQERYSEAEKLLSKVLEVRTAKLGNHNIKTVEAMEGMSNVYKGQNRNAEAQKLLEAALATRTQLIGRADIFTIFTMIQLAEVLDKQNHHTEANTLRQEALTIESTRFGTLHIGTLWTMAWIARAYDLQGRSDEAGKLLEQALAGMKEIRGMHNVATLDIMGHLAHNYEEQRRFAEAESLRKEELALRREVQGDRAIETLNVLQWFTRFYFEQERAEDMLKVAKELAESRSSVLGEHNADTIVAYSALGCAYQSTNQYHQAEEVRRHEVHLRKEVLGYERADTFTAIGAIAKAVFDQGRIAEAEALWNEEIAGRQRLLEDKQDMALLGAINSLSILTYVEKRFEEAEDMAKEVLVGRRKLLGEEDLSTLRALQWLGRIYIERGNFPEAEKLWEELLPKQKKLMGEDHPETLNTYFRIGCAKFEQAKWAEAEATWSELYQKRKSSLGEKHIDTIDLLQRLSTCASQQSRPSEAASLNEIDVALRTEVLGPKNTTVYEAMGRLVRSYTSLGGLDDAEKVANKMVEIGEVNLGLTDEWKIQSKATVAYVFHCQGRFSESATLTEQVLNDRIAQLGGTHILVARSKSRLAAAYEALGRYEEANSLAEEAAVIQRKELSTDNVMLLETLELLKKLAISPTLDVNDPSNLLINSPDVDHSSNQDFLAPFARENSDRQESIDIDGYKTFGNDLEQISTPPHLNTRSISPYEQRSKFGRTPNPWSMFM